MRTTPLLQWSVHAVEFDKIVLNTTQSILGCTLPPPAYAQAGVSTRFGGLGIRRIVDHAPVAFSASWCTSRKVCEEKWLPMDGVPDHAPGQRWASEDVDRATLDRLVAEGSARDKQRLRRLDCLHANSWITALPSATDGRDTILPTKVFVTAVLRLLGLPVYHENNTTCPLCMQTMDKFGDHALCCKRTGDMIARHNRVRNWLFKLADIALLNPEMEKLGLLGPGDVSRRRPGDVSLPLWQFNKGLAIDVAVICPVAPCHMNQEVPCEYYAATQKHDRYDPGFVDSRYDFAAMVFETSGAVNLEGRSILKQIFRFASKRECVGNSVYAGRAWARLGCVIQYAVAQSILIRDVGVEE